MAWAPDLFTGKRIGKYELLCRLAVGGMAEIFLGFARSGLVAGRPVVLKNLLQDQKDDPDAVKMLINEAKLTASLTHPNIAQVIDLEQSSGNDVLLVIEFIQGANLEEVAEAAEKRKETVPLGFSISAIRDAAQGLAHAHGYRDAKGVTRPIVHRDVTPRNVMVDYDGVGKMLDFGIARLTGTKRFTQAGMVRGTAAYMSPEQAIGEDVDTRSDLFSLGIIFHELLTGQRLFARGNAGAEMAAVYDAEIPLPSKVNRRVPKQLDPVVMKALERDRDQRYQNASDFIRELTLAAGPTAWPKERCSELLRERFADRQRDIRKLLQRIPEGLDGGEVSPRPSSSRSAVQRSAQVPAPSPGATEDEALRTQIAGQSMLGTNDSMPLTAVESGAASTNEAGSTNDAGSTSDEDNATRVSGSGRGAPAPAPPRASSNNRPQTSMSDRSLGKSVTAPRSNQRDSSSITLSPMQIVLLAAVVALVVGSLGGVLVYKSLQPSRADNPQPIIVTQPTTPAKPPPIAVVKPTEGKLTLTTDRPASVMLKGQIIGQTPLLGAMLPAGRHLVILAEPDGKARELEVSISVGAETRMTVALDELHEVP